MTLRIEASSAARARSLRAPLTLFFPRREENRTGCVAHQLRGPQRAHAARRHLR
jgi:hypothetical protein